MAVPHDPELFMRPDGLPMVFLMLPGRSSCEARASIKKDIEMRGGLLLVSTRDSIYAENSILLLFKNEVPHRYQEMFDHRFVLDCIYENMILPNLIDYRVTRKTHSFKSYDPLDILHGYKGWSDLETVTQGEVVSDIEDGGEDESLAQTRKSPVRSYKTYNRKNQEEIVKYLVRFAAYKMVKGNSIWQKLESLNVCKGERTWQSMKEHFRKKIIHQIHTFGLSWRQVRRFRDTFGLDQEHESDINSEEEEGEDNEKQKSPKSSHSSVQKSTFKNSFQPRRTSSPMLQPDQSCLEPNTAPAVDNNEMNIDHDAEDQQQSIEVNKHAEADPDSGPSNDQANSNQVNEGEPEETRPAKRKRKLFSTNCSYLNDNELDNQKINVTPVRKQQTLQSLIEEQEDEVLTVYSLTSVNTSLTSSVKETENCGDKSPISCEPKTIGANKSDYNVPSGTNECENSFLSATSSIQKDLEQGQTMETENKGEADPGVKGRSVHMESLEEIFGPDASPLLIPPAKRKSKKDHFDKPLLLNENTNSSAEKIVHRSTSAVSNSSKAQTDGHVTATVAPKLLSEQAYGGNSRSPSPKKREGRTSSILLNTPTSVCCRKVNTVDVEAIEHLRTPAKVRGARRKSTNTNEAEASTSERNKEKGKENFEKDYWYKVKHRTAFGRGEEEAIVKYFLDHGGFSIRGGNTVWKKMEDEQVCPGRTWQALRERFEKHIEPNLRQFGSSKTDMVKADRNHNITKQTAGRKNCNFYSTEEDLRIIRFIVDNRRFLDVGGNELWKIMEERTVLEGRSWQSMKERFRKGIAPKINQYKLDKTIVANFVKGYPTKKEKRIK